MENKANDFCSLRSHPRISRETPEFNKAVSPRRSPAWFDAVASDVMHAGRVADGVELGYGEVAIEFWTPLRHADASQDAVNSLTRTLASAMPERYTEDIR